MHDYVAPFKSTSCSNPLHCILSHQQTPSVESGLLTFLQTLTRLKKYTVVNSLLTLVHFFLGSFGPLNTDIFGLERKEHRFIDVFISRFQNHLRTFYPVIQKFYESTMKSLQTGTDGGGNVKGNGKGKEMVRKTMDNRERR